MIIRVLLPLLLACLLAGCSQTVTQSTATPASSPTATARPTSSPIPPPQIISSGLAGLAATLEDETHELPGGQMAWTTYWKLRWNAYPGAQGYELETLTGEGVSRKLRRQTETCFRLDIAKGQNEKAKGLFNRELMLASIAGQMAYRVRATLDGNRATQWSPLLEVGRTDLPKK